MINHLEPNDLSFGKSFAQMIFFNNKLDDNAMKMSQCCRLRLDFSPTAVLCSRTVLFSYDPINHLPNDLSFAAKRSYLK